MKTPIKNETLSTFLTTQQNSAATELLANEINGLRTVFHSIAPNDPVQPETSPTKGRVYLFTSGNGTLRTEGQTYEIDEITFFAPCHTVPFTIRTDTSLTLLELIIDLSPTDRTELSEAAAKFPIFRPYSNCKTYRERIKSEKTTSRTLLPEFTFPRLCLGSVQTAGDDRVAPHKHPMLEQLFFGLDHNDCILTADGIQLAFKENMLVHVPLGSTHGVEVHAPKKLHYIWIDLFKDKKGMDWVVQEHIHDE